MTEVLVIDRTVAFMLSMMGGATGALVISTIWGAYSNYRQNQELQRQSEFMIIQAEVALLVLEELRRRRK